MTQLQNNKFNPSGPIQHGCNIIDVNVDVCGWRLGVNKSNNDNDNIEW